MTVPGSRGARRRPRLCARLRRGRAATRIDHSRGPKPNRDDERFDLRPYWATPPRARPLTGRVRCDGERCRRHRAAAHESHAVAVDGRSRGTGAARRHGGCSYALVFGWLVGYATNVRRAACAPRRWRRRSRRRVVGNNCAAHRRIPLRLSRRAGGSPASGGSGFTRSSRAGPARRSQSSACRATLGGRRAGVFGHRRRIGTHRAYIATVAAASLRLGRLGVPRALRLYRRTRAGGTRQEARFGVAQCYRRLGDRSAEAAALETLGTTRPVSRQRHASAARRIARTQGTVGGSACVRAASVAE